ncbi:MAG TPA: M20 family metallopeptidase [Anaerolineae bacterium]|nr:M20 family metallopeptidase [Anaerolineae bacterium]
MVRVQYRPQNGTHPEPHSVQFEQPETGNYMKATWGMRPDSTLMLCHMDTVWSVGTTASHSAI